MPYQQVADALRERLDAGEWVTGEALPSVSALGREYGVSRATAARSIKVLVAEGRVETVAGWGSFVRER